jgi:hypothetical protein
MAAYSLYSQVLSISGGHVLHLQPEDLPCCGDRDPHNMVPKSFYINEELCNLYASQNIIRVIKLRRMRWAWYVACMGEMRNAYNILVGIPKGTRPHGHRWENNIRMGVRDRGWEGVVWTYLTQDMDQWLALVNTVMILQVP